MALKRLTRELKKLSQYSEFSCSPSDEDFMKDNETISFLKLRASYGTLGNLVGDNLYRSLLNGEGTYVFDGKLVDGIAQGGLPNPIATWETAEKLDIGLDVNFFDDKLTVVADYFEETRKDLLIQNFPVSGILNSFFQPSLYCPIQRLKSKVNTKPCSSIHFPYASGSG